MKEWYVRLLPDDKFTFTIEILSDFDQTLSSPTINNTLSQHKEELISGSIFKRTESIGSTPIEKLGLSVRAYNALRRANIHVVDQLKNMKKRDFQKIRNFGNTNYEEVVKALAKLGIKMLEE